MEWGVLPLAVSLVTSVDIGYLMLWGFSTLTSAFTEILAAKNGLGWFFTLLR